MQFRKSSLSVFSILTVLVSLGAPSAHALNPVVYDECEAVFDSPSKPHTDYTDDARRKAEAQGILPAEFFDDAQARVAAKTWGGSAISRLFSGALPKGITLIDHELFKTNEPGLVKFSAAEFVSLRATIHFEGQEVGTNIGVNPQALIDNLSRPNKSLVPNGTKAVLIADHGGGTTTTGHHVFIQMANYLRKFGIEVISFDQLWHAEGPREGFRDFAHYSEYMRQLVREYVSPAGVPIFLGGHSMGGLFADLYMRTHPNDDLFKGVIALSPVPDMAPGGTLLEKLDAQSRLDSIPPELLDRLADSDHGAGDALLGQGKITPLAEYYEGDFTARNDWTIPAHGGKDYLPALFVWGSGDWLYVGKEQLINQYIGGLSNVELKVYDERVTVTEIGLADKSKAAPRPEKIGHLIFDHYPKNVTSVETAKSSNLEAYQDVRDFISKVLGIELKREENKVASGAKGQNEIFLRTFLANYINNLAFREFMDQAKEVNFEAPAQLRQVQGLAFKGLQLSGKIKNPGKNDDVAKLEAELAQIRETVVQATGISDLKEVVDRFKGEWVPAGPEGDAGRAMSAQKTQLEERSRALDQQLKGLRKNYEVARKAAQVAASQFKKLLATEFANYSPVATKAADERVSATFAVLKASHQKVSEAISAFRAELYRTGEPLPPEVPLPIRALIKEYGAALAVYQKAELDRDNTQLSDIRQGYAGADLQNSLREMERTSEAAELERRQIESMETEQQFNWIKSQEIKRALIEKYDNRFLSVVTVTGREILSRAWNDYDTATMSLLNQFWTRWKTIYKDRPEEAGSVSLY